MVRRRVFLAPIALASKTVCLTAARHLVLAGCSIGCDKCDGSRNSAGKIDGTIPKFLYKGMNRSEVSRTKTTFPVWNPAPGDMVLDPTFKPAGLSNCNKLQKPKICDHRLRTVNSQAECGSPEDIYSQSPWRA